MLAVAKAFDGGRGESGWEYHEEGLTVNHRADFTAWSSNLGNNYLAGRTSTDVSSTLKIIGVSVGYDADKNGSLGTDEITVTLTTQYAKRS